MGRKYPKTQTIEVCISDFENGIDTETAENISNFNQSVNSYNFDYKSGALTESIGFEELTIPSSFEENCAENPPLESEGTNYIKIGAYRQFDATENKRTDKLIAITTENKVEFCRLVTAYPAMMNLDDKTFVEIPNLFNYNDGTYDCILFTSESDGVQSWDDISETKTYQSLPVVTNICQYNGRTFITMGGERLVIRTEYGNLLNWTSDLALVDDLVLDGERGSVNKLINMDGYMFAIRDYGITRIKWYDGGEDYDVSHIMFSGGKIYGNTACNCGKIGLVLCKDGIYQFDSVNAKKLNLGLNNMFKGISNKNAVAMFRNGIYYLACRLNFNDDKVVGCEAEEGFKNNTIIAFDVASGKYTISRGIDVASLCAVQFESFDKLLACFNTQYGTKIGQLVDNGTTFGQNQSKYWRSPLTDLGYSNKVKSVKEISLLSKYDAVVSVFTENEKREFAVKGSEILCKFPVRIKGKQVGISISSETPKAFISNVKLNIELLDTEYV